MSRWTIACSCGKLIEYGTTCKCRKRKSNNKEADKDIKSYRWKQLRKHILKRDGAHCQRCLIKYGRIECADMTVHHIKNRRDYPELVFDKSNLVALCRTCNLQIGTKDLDFDWIVPDEYEFSL
ncbi:HNH endonuclease [Priestia aryabhattai]|uniref:HNH endonuclease n=1 Tax=Priestia aryabhattai TaxID=412384 RepID=UPI001C8D6745|nr:HNH endonuclease [Priestia aryabhattai]MBY0214131.1 HNH endonuclease [Priestia aryabhattai]